MYRNKFIIGHSEGKLCEKGRIIIPSFAYAQLDGEVVLQKTEFDGDIALKILAFKEYLAIIDRFQTLRNNTHSLDEYLKYTQEIEKICYSLKHLTEIDSQKRMSIPQILINEFNWIPQDTLIYDGLGESLLVRKKS